MVERIHEGPIDAEVVLRWGYDMDLLLSDQDEDLLLGFEEHFPALAQLAKDPQCPKADYALQIIDFRLMFRALYNRVGAAAQIERTMQLLSDSSLPNIVEFRAVQELRLRMLSGLGPTDRDRALQIGTAALNGVSRRSDITIEDRGSEWVVQLSVPPFHAHREWLTINKTSGEFSFHR